MKIVSILLGAVSFVLLTASVLAAYSSLYAMVAAKGSNAGAMSVILIIAIVLLILGLICALGGIVFAVIGLFSHSPNKMPVFIGLGLNLLVIFSFVAAVIYGIYYLLENIKGRPFG